ncbi:MAG: apolipoprotein N-acyltransferase [Hyphomonadaceae bacterium]
MTHLVAERGSLAARIAQLEELAAWRRYAVAAGAGLFSNLAYAPVFFFPALAIGFVALIWLLDGAARRPRPMRAAFARGWMFAFFYFLGGLYWVYASFEKVDGALIFMVPATLALPAGLALFWGAACAAMMRFWRPGAVRIVVFTVAIMAAEWARGHLFGGFPWNLPAYVWPAGGAISQAASMIGVYGLSLLTVLALSTPAALGGAGPAGARVAPLLTAALALGLAWGAGDQRLTRAAAALPGKTIVRVADAGFTQEEKWAPGNEVRVFRGYLDLIDGPRPSRADVDIWPESAVPVLLLEQPDFLDAISAKLGPRTLIVGAVRSEPSRRGPVFYNSAVVLTGASGAARLGQIYNKSRLVPFGEFIPLWRQIAPLAEGLRLKALQQIGSGFEPGDPPMRMIVPGAPPATVLICYEAIFPGLVPRGAERPDWIVNLTNDAWFGGLSGPYQHYNQARYRAIEEGLPLARAASGGISAIIDPYGRPIAATGLKGGIAEAALPQPLPPTIFARFGGLGPGVTFALVLLLGVALGRKRDVQG